MARKIIAHNNIKNNINAMSIKMSSCFSIKHEIKFYFWFSAADDMARR